MKKKISNFSIVGYFVFILTITFVVVGSIFLFNFLKEIKIAKPLMSLFILIYISIAALVFSIIDMIRRKIMIENPVEEILIATKKITNGDFNINLKSNHSYNKYDAFDIIKDNLNIMAKELSNNEILKSDFISNVSHEIKTPLSVIQNYALALSNPKLTEENKKEFVNTLQNAVSNLTSLVNNVLKLNKLENQTLNPNITKFNISELIRQNIISFESIIEKRNIEIICNIDEIYINSNYDYLQIIFNNLISNAIKFSKDSGIINISIIKNNNLVSISISDNGCGIDRETGKYIFDKFYQGDTSHKSEGNGLGLALVKKVLDILGGQISVDSTINQGSTFTIVLNDEQDI